MILTSPSPLRLQELVVTKSFRLCRKVCTDPFQTGQTEWRAWPTGSSVITRQDSENGGNVTHLDMLGFKRNELRFKEVISPW